MPKRKLTPSLKQKIRDNYSRLKKSDYGSEALVYLNRVRGAAKGRKAKAQEQQKTNGKARGKTKSKPGSAKGNKTKQKARKKKQIADATIFRVCGKTVKPGTPLHELIANAAKAKKQSVKKFVRENEKAICELIKDYLIVDTKEIDRLIFIINDLPKSRKIFSPVKGPKVERVRVSYNLQEFKSYLLTNAKVYEQILIEYAYDLSGNIHVDVPEPEEYDGLVDRDLLDWIDNNYPNITYFER